MNKYTTTATQLFAAMTQKETPNGSDPLKPDRAMRLVQTIFGNLTNYVNSVVQYEITVPMLQFKYDGEDFKARFQTIDQKRHDAHNLAISEVCRINRLCEHYGVESPVPDIGTEATDDIINNPNIRQTVSDFCGEFVLDTFVHRDGKTQNLSLAHTNTLNTAKEPHLDKAVSAANKQPYKERIPVDISQINDSELEGNSLSL